MKVVNKIQSNKMKRHYYHSFLKCVNYQKRAYTECQENLKFCLHLCTGPDHFDF